MTLSEKQKRTSYLVVGALLLSVVLHSYLAYQHYNLYFSLSPTSSICNVNAIFDCDSVNVSPYSKLLGFPLALWGAVTNAILLIMFLMYWLSLEKDLLLGRMVKLLSVGVFGASLVMGIISVTSMSVYCLFCIGAYILSIVQLYAIFRTVPGSWLSHLVGDVQLWLTKNRGALGCWLAIPLVVWLVDAMAWRSFGKRITANIEESVHFWERGRVLQMDTTGALKRGDEGGAMQIVEFADFLCPHCMMASKSVKLFLKSHPDVGYQFLVFPLDGSCNPEMSRSVELPCELAKATLCASGMGRGWEFHDSFFEQQSNLRSMESVQEAIAKLVQTHGLNEEELRTCMMGEEVLTTIRRQTKEATLAGLQGTPFFVINGKVLSAHHLLPTLDAVYRSITTKPYSP